MLLLHRNFLLPVSLASLLWPQNPCSAQPRPVSDETAYALPAQITLPPTSSSLTPAQLLEAQGDALMARREYVAALEAFKQVQPRTAVVWNKIGIAYHHLFALDQALINYKQAVALDPHYAEAYNNMGAVYYGQRAFSPAEKAYKRCLKYHPRMAGTYSNLGTLYFAEAKFKKGAKAYQRALELDPDVFNHQGRQPIEEPASREQRMATAFYLAEVYATAGKNDEALASLRRALSNGFSDRKRLMGDRGLAALRDTPEFHQLMIEQHIE